MTNAAPSHLDMQTDMLGSPVPDHVPRELIRRIDLYDGPGLDRDPFEPIRSMTAEPPIIYNLMNAIKGQTWVPTRAADIRRVAGDPQLFSSVDQLGFGLLIGEDWKLGPIEMDPPEHTKYRRIMSPWLAPPAVAKLSDKVRNRAVELIEKIGKQGRCEFMSEFGLPYPISIFMEMMGLPHAHTDDFLRWNSQLLHTGNEEVKRDGIKSTVNYLRTLIEERRAHPTGDLVSQAIAATVDGEPLSDTDLLGVCYLLFAGGLDTVAASLGFFFNHLAQNPDHQTRLRANPDDIPRAIEEYLRTYAPSQALRCATADTEIAGQFIKKGDWVNLIFSLANLDASEFADPGKVDIERMQNRHMTFSFGPHFCMGMHLARRELQIALEEWLTRLPPFRLVNNVPAEMHGGLVFGVNRLDLEW